MPTPSPAASTTSTDATTSGRSAPTASDRPSEPASDRRASPPEPTAADLEALRRRDPAAIKRWVYGNRHIVRGFLRTMVADDERAGELLQETFFQALRSIDRFRGDAKVSTWLCSIARNLAFRHFNQQDRYTTVPAETLEWMEHRRAPARSAAPGADPRRQTERAERKALVHAALQELPASYREVIQRRDLDEESTAEVAEALGLTRVNVRVRLHRARQRLEALLRPRLGARFAQAA